MWCGRGESTYASPLSVTGYRAVQNPQRFRPLRLTFVLSCSIQCRAVGGQLVDNVVTVLVDPGEP